MIIYGRYISSKLLQSNIILLQELGLDFRRYLERGKFNQELTNALLALYSEREWPQNPNEYPFLWNI